MAPGDEYFEDLLKINLEYEGERNTAENVIYASNVGAHGASLGALNTIATNIGEYVGANLMPLVSSAVSLILTTVADWTSADGLTGSYVSDTAGGLSGGKLPSQVCTMGNYETLTRYRGGRGRIYFPQPDTTKMETDTTYTTAFQEAMQDAMVGVFNFINDQAIGEDLCTVVLYHRAGNKVVPQGYEDVVAITCNITPATQRRRVRRVGHLR